MTGIIRKKNPGEAWESLPDDSGGDASLTGGAGDNGTDSNASISAGAGDGAGNPGRLYAKTANASGVGGQALVSDGNDCLVFGGVMSGAGAPAAAPNGFLPMYLDTSDSQALYVWDGATWQGPYVVTP